MGYRDDILGHILEYLKLKNWKTKKAGGIVMVKCPYCENLANESASLIPHTYTIKTHCCSKKINLIDFVKVIEPDKIEMSDEDILTYLRDLLKIKVELPVEIAETDEIFDFYEKNEFDLASLVKNTKNPIKGEKWSETIHKSKIEWGQWKEIGLNMALKTGKRSNVLVLDFDVIPSEEVKKLLGNTFAESTKRGFHYFYKYDPEIPKCGVYEFKILTADNKELIIKNPNIPVTVGTTVKRMREIEVNDGFLIKISEKETLAKLIEKIHFDVESDGGMITLYPSIVDGVARKIISKTEIISIPEELKKYIIDKREVKQSEEVNNFNSNDDTYKFQLLTEGDGRNEFFTHFGGMLRKELSAPQTEYVLNLFNKVACNPMLPQREIQALMKKLEQYNNLDDNELVRKIMNYFSKVEQAGLEDVRSALNLSRTGKEKEMLDTIMTKLSNEEYLLRFRKYYKLSKKIEWSDNLSDEHQPIDFKMPIFDDVAHFAWGDMILIGATPKTGKTTMAQGFLLDFIEQKIKPYYWYSEPGSRYAKIALSMGMKDRDYFKTKIPSDYREFKFEPHSVNIIDWLMIEDKAKTDLVFKYITDELDKAKAIAIVFQQLKERQPFGNKEPKSPRDLFSWFAPNLVAQFPSLATMYLYDDLKQVDGKYGAFYIDNIRERKIHTKKYTIPCIYDEDTKRIKRIDELEPPKEEKTNEQKT